MPFPAAADPVAQQEAEERGRIYMESVEADSGLDDIGELAEDEGEEDGDGVATIGTAHEHGFPTTQSTFPSPSLSLSISIPPGAGGATAGGQYAHTSQTDRLCRPGCSLAPYDVCSFIIPRFLHCLSRPCMQNVLVPAHLA